MELCQDDFRRCDDKRTGKAIKSRKTLCLFGCHRPFQAFSHIKIVTLSVCVFVCNHKSRVCR